MQDKKAGMFQYFFLKQNGLFKMKHYKDLISRSLISRSLSRG